MVESIIHFFRELLLMFVKPVLLLFQQKKALKIEYKEMKKFLGEDSPAVEEMRYLVLLGKRLADPKTAEYIFNNFTQRQSGFQLYRESYEYFKPFSKTNDYLVLKKPLTIARKIGYVLSFIGLVTAGCCFLWLDPQNLKFFGVNVSTMLGCTLLVYSVIALSLLGKMNAAERLLKLYQAECQKNCENQGNSKKEKLA